MMLDPGSRILDSCQRLAPCSNAMLAHVLRVALERHLSGASLRKPEQNLRKVPITYHVSDNYFTYHVLRIATYSRIDIGTYFYVSRIYVLRIATYLRIAYRIRHMKGIVLRKNKCNLSPRGPSHGTSHGTHGTSHVNSQGTSHGASHGPSHGPSHGHKILDPASRSLGPRSWIQGPGAGSRIQHSGSSLT